MTVERSYLNRGCRHMSVCDSVVPDTRLQAIADAYRNYRNPVDAADRRDWWYELRALLNAPPRKRKQTMLDPPRRCPAIHIALIENEEIKDIWRCEKPTRHRMPHEAKGTRWTFVEGSYSGLSTEHPDFCDMVEETDDECPADRRKSRTTTWSALINAFRNQQDALTEEER